MLILEKVTVAALSAITLSLILTMVFVWDSAEDTGWSYLPLLFVYLIYSLPVYLIGGTLYSLLVDLSIGRIQFRNKLLKYFTELIIYAAGGVLIIGVLEVTSRPEGNDGGLYIDRVLIFGAFAAILFYHISLAVKKWKS